MCRSVWSLPLPQRIAGRRPVLDMPRSYRLAWRQEARVKITILGAGRCVTGSKYLLQWKHFTAMVDSGLFQGPARYRRLNWKPLPHPAAGIEAVILTHAHIDHSGYLPRLCRQGFAGPVSSESGSISERARYSRSSSNSPVVILRRMADSIAA